MKKLSFSALFATMFVFLSKMAYGSPLVSETPVLSYGTPTTVSVSTSAWTLIPASQSLAGQSALYVSVPGSNNAAMAGHLGSCTSTSIATSVRPIEIPKGGFTILSISDDVCLYLISLHTAAENVHVQEVKQ